MTASSGGTTSNQYAITVNATSGSEDWADVPKQVFGHHSFCVCKSGLIIIIFTASTSRFAPSIKTINQKKVLNVPSGGDTEYLSSEFGLLFPTPATRITVNVVQKFRPYGNSRITSFRDDNFISEHPLSDNDGAVGEHTFQIGVPVRLVRWTCWSYDGSPFNFSNISWSSD